MDLPRPLTSPSEPPIEVLASTVPERDHSGGIRGPEQEAVHKKVEPMPGDASVPERTLAFSISCWEGAGRRERVI